MRVKLPIIAVAMTLLITGCAGSGPKRHLANTQSHMLSQGKPPAYVEGYLDGCSTGRRLAGDKHFAYRKNNERAEADSLYARGWQDGQINCRNEVLAEAQKKPGTTHHGLDVSSTIQENRRTQDEAEMREIWEQLRK